MGSEKISNYTLLDANSTADEDYIDVVDNNETDLTEKNKRIKIIELKKLFSQTTGGNFDSYDNTKTYTGGETYFVVHDNNIWEFISETDKTGVDPGTDNTVWEKRLAGDFVQNTINLTKINFVHNNGSDTAAVEGQIQNPYKHPNFPPSETEYVYVLGSVTADDQLNKTAAGVNTGGTWLLPTYKDIIDLSKNTTSLLDDGGSDLDFTIVGEGQLKHSGTPGPQFFKLTGSGSDLLVDGLRIEHGTIFQLSNNDAIFKNCTFYPTSTFVSTQLFSIAASNPLFENCKVESYENIAYDVIFGNSTKAHYKNVWIEKTAGNVTNAFQLGADIILENCYIELTDSNSNSIDNAQASFHDVELRGYNYTNRPWGGKLTFSGPGVLINTNTGEVVYGNKRQRQQQKISKFNLVG